MENIKTLSGLNTSDFKKCVNGQDTSLFILKNNNGMEVTISNYGARIVSLVVPDAEGKLVDVVAGHSSIDDYLNSEEKYLGAVCGRYANRIAGARFEIDGVEYNLTRNDGQNCLHGGEKGFHNVVWYVEKGVLDNSVELTYKSVAGEEGFPGTLTAITKYFVNDNNELQIFYVGYTDKSTVVNFTNHSYFNLSGAGAPSIDDHLLWINAKHYLPTDEHSIPLAKMEKVAGTPMDFTIPRRIGDGLHSPFPQLIAARGYDHTYVLDTNINDYTHGDPKAAYCISPKTGIMMEVCTTEPGLQLYTGNFMQGNQPGKNGMYYPKHSALCLETQHFPNSPNRPDYPSALLTPNVMYHSRTTFKFKADKNFK
ncbi:MAG: galactose mutarotase [Tannerellaceae bacterium]|nr:galactose mutarotase [Tannerellaceae bacterium]